MNEGPTLVETRRVPNEALRDIPDSYRDALRYLRSRTFTRSSRYRAQQWKADRRGADPKLLEWEAAFIRRLEKLDIPVFAPVVFRSERVQQRLYVTGKSDQQPGESLFNHGLAIQIVHAQHGRNLPKLCWDLLGHLGKEVARQTGIDMEWQGDKPGGDPAEWVLTDPSDPILDFADVPAWEVKGVRVPDKFQQFRLPNARPMTTAEQQEYSAWLYGLDAKPVEPRFSEPPLP